MLKMFTPAVAPGSDPEHWDRNWEAGDMPQALADPRVCENDPVHPVLMAKARPDRLFLEGGCGQGQWVKYLHERGYRAMGVDFAPRVVERFRRLVPGADVRLGDVRRLPLARGEVHTYYSGGVVEHDEEGPDPALVEARRVIAPDGWFLCSVPDTTKLRDSLLFRHDITSRLDLDPPMVVTRVAKLRPEEPPSGMRFFQYAFNEAEFGDRLAAAGFEIVETFGYGLVWGLMELPRVQRAIHALVSRPGALSSSDHRATSFAVEARPRRAWWKELALRALIAEDRTLPAVGPLIRFAADRFSNMRMYVARPC